MHFKRTEAGKRSVWSGQRRLSIVVSTEELAREEAESTPYEGICHTPFKRKAHTSFGGLCYSPRLALLVLTGNGSELLCVPERLDYILYRLLLCCLPDSSRDCSVQA